MGNVVNGLMDADIFFSLLMGWDGIWFTTLSLSSLFFSFCPGDFLGEGAMVLMFFSSRGGMHYWIGDTWVYSR